MKSLDKERYQELFKRNPSAAFVLMWEDLEHTRNMVTTWYDMSIAKSREYCIHLNDLRKRNDEVWAQMNETRALLGRLRTRAAAGENLAVPLENELNRLHNILKRNHKLKAGT